MSKHITNVKKVSGTAESKAKQVLKEKELLDENQLAVQDVEKAKELSLIETSTEEQLVAQNTDNYSDVSYAGGEAMLVTDANVTGADALVASEVGATEGAVASSSAGTLAYAAVGALGAAGLVGLMLNNSSSGGVNNNNARDNQINHNDTQPTPQVQATQQNSNTSQNIPKQDDAPNDNNNTPIVLPELKVSYDENTQTITLYNLQKGEFKYKLLATDDWLISNTSDFTDVTENPDGTVTVKYNIPQDIQGSGDPDPVEFNIITKQGERESNTVNYTYDKVTIVELDEPQIIQNDDTTCTIKVTGLSEPGATVVITIDGEKPQEKTITLGDEQYEFEVEFTVEQTVLYQNLNINATATDTANNTATLEQAVEVTINPSNKLLTLSLVEDTGISSKPETLTDKVTSKTDIKVDGIDDFNATSYVWSSDNGATWNNGNSSVFKGTETSGNVNILAALSQDGNSPDDNAGDPISFSYTYDNVVEGITNPKYDFANEFKDYINNPTGEIVLGFSGSSSREKTIVDYTFSQKGQEDQTESFINDNLGNDYACYFKVINNGESFKLTIKETDYVGNTQTQSSIQGTTPLDIEYIDSLSASINLEPYYTNRVETSLNQLGWKDLQNQNLVLVGGDAIVSVDELNNEATMATVYFRVDYKLSDKNINASDNFNDHISVKINDVDATVLKTNFSGGITSYYKVEVPLSALDTTPGDHQLNSIEVIYTDRNGQTASLLKETVSGEYQYTNGNETKVHLNFAYTVEDTSNGDRSVSDYQYNSNGFATNSLIDDGLQANSGLI